MKVALCLSGFPRIIHHTLPYLQKYVLDELDPDIYFFGYSDEVHGISSFDLKNILSFRASFIRPYTEKNQNLIWKEYGTKEIKDNQLAKGEPIDILSQYFNMQGSFVLCEAISNARKFKYDCVIRARTDYFFCRPIEKDHLKNLKENTVYIPDVWDFGGVSSGFAFGDFESMKKYSYFFNHIRQYNIEEGRTFHPEALKAYHLGRQGLSREVVAPYYWWELEDFKANGYEGSIINNDHLNYPRRNKFR